MRHPHSRYCVGLRGRSRTTFAAMLVGTVIAAIAPARAQHPAAKTPAPIVVVLPFVLSGDSTHADTTLVEHGITALLESQLATGKRVRIASHSGGQPPPADTMTTGEALAFARNHGASHAVLGMVTRVGDSLRVSGRVLRARDTVTIVLDTLTTPLDEVPTLINDLAESVADSIAPRTDATRGGPLFRPPRPPVPFAAVTLYSRAVKARAAGDPDTAVKLLRQAASIAPQWEQAKLELAALKGKP